MVSIKRCNVFPFKIHTILTDNGIQFTNTTFKGFKEVKKIIKELEQEIELEKIEKEKEEKNKNINNKVINEKIDNEINKETMNNNKLQTLIDLKKLYKNKLKCPMESQISHTLADLLTSRPKAYSLKTLTKILKIRLLYKNNHDIKRLYLNNYNKKDILTINAEHLNYEIFNKNNNYQINNKMIPVNYHPGFHPDNTLNYNIRL